MYLLWVLGGDIKQFGQKMSEGEMVRVDLSYYLGNVG